MSPNLMSNATRRAAIAAAVATALALRACGGGENTVNDKPGVALFTNMGTEVSVTHGAGVAEYRIGGGAE